MIHHLQSSLLNIGNGYRHVVPSLIEIWAHRYYLTNGILVLLSRLTWCSTEKLYFIFLRIWKSCVWIKQIFFSNYSRRTCSRIISTWVSNVFFNDWCTLLFILLLLRVYFLLIHSELFRILWCKFEKHW